MKYFICLLRVAVTALVLSACGGDGGSQAPTSEAPPEDQSATENDQPPNEPESGPPGEDSSTKEGESPADDSDSDPPPEDVPTEEGDTQPDETDPEPPEDDEPPPEDSDSEPPPEEDGEPTYHIGGTSVGINEIGEPVILQLNDSEYIEITSDGPFVFSTDLPAGTEYTVAMSAFPQSPGGQPRCSLMGTQGLVQENSEDALHLRCIPNFFAEGEFSVDGLIISWANIKVSYYDAYAMPVGISDISNYAAYPEAEMVPNAKTPLASLEVFNLGERDFIIEADFGDGHSFQTDPLTELNATPLGGIIHTDQSLSESHSPYKLYENIQLAHGITVTLDPGVHLEGENKDFSVFGILQVEGSSDNNVRINNLHIVPGNNLTSDPPFRIELSFLSLSGGSLYYPTGNAIYGTLTLTDSAIEDIPYVHIWYPVDDVTIARNVFVDAGGLSIGISNGVNATIENNVFIRNKGSSSYSGYAVQSWATYDPSELIVTKNSFLSTDRIAVELRAGHSNTSMDARGNYWETIDEGVIESMIYDRNDDLSTAGHIPYTPYLSEPHPDTPAMDPELLDP